jgi:hypothetical protein
MESVIIENLKMKHDLFKICGFKTNSQQLKLLYRGSLHGLRASTFHAKCDHISKTLTVVKAAKSGNIFGGYTEATWNQPSWDGYCYKEDANAFLFSLVNKEKNPVKINIAVGEEKSAILACETFGPFFGKFNEQTGCDILINLNKLHGEYSLSNIGSSYFLPNYQHDSIKAKSLMSGFNDSYFRIEEIEVFQLH